MIAEPFVVPREADDETLERYRQRLEQEIGRAERRCQELLENAR